MIFLGVRWYFWGYTIEQQPLTSDPNGLLVNVLRCRMTTTDKKTQETTTTFIGTWITDLPITIDNIGLLVSGARARWRIENECFNTFAARHGRLKAEARSPR